MSEANAQRQILKLPWALHEPEPKFRTYINDCNGRSITESRIGGITLEQMQFIVRSVNAHDQLVAALRDLISLAEEAMDDANNGGKDYDPNEELANARAALSAAEGDKGASK